MPEFDPNWLAVLVAVVAMQFLGFLWYGPLFGKLWLRAMGRTEMEANPRALVIALVANVVSAIALAWVLAGAVAPDVWTGVTYGLVIAVGFVATTALIQGAYEASNRTTATIYVTFNFVGYAAMGAILGAWQ